MSVRIHFVSIARNTSWEEAEEMAADRAEWRQRVAQWIHLDVG